MSGSSARVSRRIRVGIVDYLNSRPLAWSFLHHPEDDRFAVSFHSPARVADLLRSGEVDVGLIPSVELQRIPALELLPGLCVASKREVRSVLLLCRTPVERIRRVALDINSRTSAALVRILLKDRYGVEPRFADCEPDVDRMLRGSEAALVIGDPALVVDRRRYFVLDLASEWWELTGLPFVFAVWAVRRGVAGADLAGVFERSLEEGLSSLDLLSAEAAAQMGLNAAEVRDYLSRNLSYRLGESERAALEEYFRRAHAHGLIPAPRPIPLWQGQRAGDD